MHQWDKYFATSEPNAKAGFKAGEEQEMAAFEMFKSKIKSGKMTFNVKPLTDSGEEKFTSLHDIDLSDVSLFIDDATPGVPFCFPYCSGADLKGWDMSGQKLYSDFSNADLRPKGETTTNLPSANLIGAILSGANLTGANLLEVKLNGANLTNAFLEEANLSGATYDL